MAKAKKRDHQGALEDYTTTIGMPGAPAELLAMVLYNRALVYVAAGDERKGAADLDAVLAMNEALVNVKMLARQKLARMESRASKSNVRSLERIPNTSRETCSS
jgi:hypothetical protein